MNTSDRNANAVAHAMPARQSGITLIELMIVVVIVGILASVAYPSYQQYVRQSNRAEAKGILLETAQFMERIYTTNGCYHRSNATCASNVTTNGCAAGVGTVNLPFCQAPKDVAIAARYNITVAYPAAAPCVLGQCFTLSAAPVGTMAGDACGTLSLTHAGVQAASGGSVADCWQR